MIPGNPAREARRENFGWLPRESRNGARTAPRKTLVVVLQGDAEGNRRAKRAEDCVQYRGTFKLKSLRGGGGGSWGFAPRGGTPPPGGGGGAGEHSPPWWVYSGVLFFKKNF